jgi:outer membrane usher protein FimD/PapC
LARAEESATGDDGDTAYFDPELLKQRGFDPALAEYLKRAPRFTPGQHWVELTVNGVQRGRAMATFDATGKLCVDDAFADVAGLVPPTLSPGVACAPIANAYAMAQAELHPESGSLALVVPIDAVRAEEAEAPGHARGGSAALLNYELFGSRSEFGDVQSDHLIANTELGLNAANWVLRSAQTFSDSNGVSRSERRHAYAERALVGPRALLQIGEITMENAVLAGALVTGVQLKPETGLVAGVRGAIDGIAQTQARVDVRQAGALIYSAIVPPGPFRLANLSLIDRVSAVEVTVTEADGSERRFSVPAASLGTSAPVAPTGYTLTIGRVRDQGGDARPPSWVASASRTWATSKVATLSIGGMAAEDYASAGLGANAHWESGTSVNGQFAFSDATRSNRTGRQFNLGVQQRLSRAWSLNASLLDRNEGFTDLLESAHAGPSTASRTDTSWSVGATLSATTAGTFGVAYSRTTTFDQIDTARGTLSWGKQVHGVSLSANAEWDLDDNATGNDDAFYFTITVPLGSKRRGAVGYNHRGDRHRWSARYEDAPTDTLRYRVNAERDTQRRETDLRADMSLLPRYAQLDVGYSQGSNGNTTTSYGLRGGVVAHRRGATFSPYPIEDSFGIVELGHVPGVKVRTPTGPVWTDWRGLAVVPSLPLYRNAAIELETKTLPRNVNVGNARQDVEVGRGTVQHLVFDVTRARRVLLVAKMPDGTPVPAGATVLDARDKLLTMVTEGGEIFLIDDPAGDALGVHLPVGGACVLEFRLPATPDPDAFYETAEATCRPGELRKTMAVGQLTSEP